MPQKKLQKIISKSNVIDIAFNLTYLCNFSCYYCIAWERNEWTFKFNEKSKEKIKYFLESIFEIKPDVKINILLSWGEPLLNPKFFEIAEFLLSFEEVSVQVTTNWYLILNLSDKLEKLVSGRFSFYITYHYLEYKKLDKSWEKIVNIINLLKSKGLKFELNFLIPTDLNDFEEFKDMKDLIISKASMNIDEYKFNLIREKWVISKKYDQKILNFYHDTLGKNLEEKESSIKAYFTDWTYKKISYTKEIIESGLNNFRWYLCYPFCVPTNILINFDLSLIFAWCSTLAGKKYSIDEAIDLMKRWDSIWVTCNTDFCTCSSNLHIKKVFNEGVSKYISGVEKVLSSKVRRILFVEWYELVDLKMLYEEWKKGFLVKYKSVWDDKYFINFVVEEIQEGANYLNRKLGFGFSHYKTNYQWGIVHEYVSVLDDNVDRFLERIYFVLPLFERIVGTPP